jgi:nitrogen regulatory protein PII
MSVKGRRYRQGQHPSPTPLAKMAAFVNHRRVIARTERHPEPHVDTGVDESEDIMLIEGPPRGPLKLIVAMIRPEQLDPIEAALDAQEVDLLSVSQVLGGAREPGNALRYRGTAHQVRCVKLRLEVVVDDWCVKAVMEAIIHAGSPGAPAPMKDMWLYVMPLDTYVAPH